MLTELKEHRLNKIKLFKQYLGRSNKPLYVMGFLAIALVMFYGYAVSPTVPVHYISSADYADAAIDTSAVTLTNPDSGTNNSVAQSTDASLASSPLTLSVGNASIMPSTNNKTTVAIPITLSRPSSEPISVSYSTAPLSAEAGVNYISTSGRLTFSTNSASISSVQKEIGITIPAQQITKALTFQINLSGYGTVATNDTQGLITLLPQPPVSSPAELSIGDSSIYKSLYGPKRTIRVSLTLSSKLSKSLTVKYATEEDVAISPQDFTAKTGSVVFSPGQTQKFIDIYVTDNINQVPDRLFYIDIISSSPKVGILKPTGDLNIINGPDSGLVTVLNKGINTATLTSNRSSKTHLFDTFYVNNTPASTTIYGSSKNTDVNSRFVFYPSTETPSVNQESCATWQSQNPPNGSGSIIQQGLALRVEDSNGITKAITITKNIYGSNDPSRPANAAFDIILWDSTKPQSNFIVIGEFILSSTLWPNGQYVPFPWNICGEVIGNTVNFEVWPSTISQPAWGNTSYGGSATIPAADLSNWSGPGYAGWYFGHVSTTSSAVYNGLTTQALN